MFGPNITGTFIASAYLGNGINAPTGAFASVTAGMDCPQGGNGGGVQYSFTASKSSSAFGRASSVQPASIRALALIKI